MNNLVVNSLIYKTESSSETLNTCPPKSLVLWKNRKAKKGSTKDESSKCDVTIPELDEKK